MTREPATAAGRDLLQTVEHLEGFDWSAAILAIEAEAAAREPEAVALLDVVTATGTIVNQHGNTVDVEFSDEEGRTISIVTFPASALDSQPAPDAAGDLWYQREGWLSTPAAEGLDVERLALAVHEAFGADAPGGCDHTPVRICYEYAVEIADTYTRLAKPTEDA